MENEEIKVTEAAVDNEEITEPAEMTERAPEAEPLALDEETAVPEAEEVTREAPEKEEPHVNFQGIDIDNEVINATSRMTPAYLKMLEERRKMMEEEAQQLQRSVPDPEPQPDPDAERKELELRLRNQKAILEANKWALFGKKAALKKEAKAAVKELEAKLAELS